MYEPCGFQRPAAAAAERSSSAPVPTRSRGHPSSLLSVACENHDSHCSSAGKNLFPDRLGHDAEPGRPGRTRAATDSASGADADPGTATGHRPQGGPRLCTGRPRMPVAIHRHSDSLRIHPSRRCPRGSGTRDAATGCCEHPSCRESVLRATLDRPSPIRLSVGPVLPALAAGQSGPCSGRIPPTCEAGIGPPAPVRFPSRRAPYHFELAAANGSGKQAAGHARAGIRLNPPHVTLRPRLRPPASRPRQRATPCGGLRRVTPRPALIAEC